MTRWQDELDELRAEVREPALRALADLPALVVADVRGDLRGCEILAADGRTLGLVTDLLVDMDRLVAEFVIVARGGGAAAQAGAGEEVVVPLSALARVSERGLARGPGLPPIPLRYRSTVALTLRVAAVVALLLALAWVLFGR